ncbi:hypothetical protein [Mycobacterium sp.]|uniref:hypothetical protein n=1 Tax=Mycobacterium sp. TaxID=1785 RepID=UPI0025D13429|nr:hypothetical protein [Mycobacterium sp.]
MSRSLRRTLLALTTTAGGLLAAVSSSALASADEWTISPGDFPAQIISEAGMPPLYQDVLEQGTFLLVDRPGAEDYVAAYVPGLLSSTNMDGITNEDFVASGPGSLNGDIVVPSHSVIDITTVGNFENIYVDLPGLGTNGANEITDTLVTPFGNINVPTAFDAAAFGSTSLPEAVSAEAAAASPAADIPFLAGDPGFSVAPDPEDGPWEITSTTGLAPFYTTVEEQGSFVVNQGAVFGNASYFSDMFGDHNVLFDRVYNGDVAQVIDQFNFGSSGFENVYSDVVGGAPDGSNAITDTFVTPFGDFSIPTLYDAAAVFDAGNFAPAAATDWVSALDADWSTLVTDFGALF